MMGRREQYVINYVELNGLVVFEDQCMFRNGREPGLLRWLTDLRLEIGTYDLNVLLIVHHSISVQ
jgi:hypothetical protein